jgi:peptidoglycan lytic transglycosylase A
VPVSPPVEIPVAPLSPVAWSEIDGWPQDDLAQVLPPLLKSCAVLKQRAGWAEICRDAAVLDRSDPTVLKRFFEERFVLLQVRNSDGSDNGTITGYYP